MSAPALGLGRLVSNGLHRASFHRLFARSFLFGTARLFKDVAVATVIEAGEILRGSLAAQIAVNALIVHKEAASDILFVTICDISHSESLLLAGKVERRIRPDKRLFELFLKGRTLSGL